MSDERLSESAHVWLREAARDQRQRGTMTERRLWAALRNRRLGGWRFRRQHPIGLYIADFLCFEARLVVEIDGDIHAEQYAYDAERDDYLKQAGYRVLRLPAASVARNLPGVLRTIEEACHLSASTRRPHPGRQG